MFEIKNVSKQFNDEFALHNISMNIGKGINFIIGASGSGKTTLLKIISGMEQDYEGEVTYCGKSMKHMSSKEKSYFYNNIFGFVWQDFHLLEDSTVLENVILPQYVKDKKNQKTAEKALKDLQIFDLASKKVKYLSGGQKQRVAIARELMKNPLVIIADEPTSALDEETSKATMAILRDIAKSKMLIIVTHDTSLIAGKDKVYELDKGELLSKEEISNTKTYHIHMEKEHKLSLHNAFHITKMNMKNKIGRFMIAALTLVVASVLLLSSMSGTIQSSSQGEFDSLFETYGDSLTDISIINSFTDASGTDGKDSKEPSGDVTQNISGLYDLYAKDERVSFVSYLQEFDNIKIQIDNQEHQIKNSGNAATINKLTTGRMPKGDGNEVVVPESFVKMLGGSTEEALGKELDFSGTMYNWTSGSPVEMKISSKVKIVGVMDTSVVYEYEGQVQSVTIDDSFLFSKKPLVEMRKQAGMKVDEMNFQLRAKTPADMIAIKDELSKKGIVPIGRFELVEDMVRLHDQTSEQAGSAGSIIGILSLVMVVAVFLLTGFMRRKEIAIYKVSGFHTTHIFLWSVTEVASYVMVAIGILLLTSPFLDFLTKKLFHVSILNMKMLFIGIVMIIITGILAYLMTILTYRKVNISKMLQSGDK